MIIDRRVIVCSKLEVKKEKGGNVKDSRMGSVFKEEGGK